MQTTENGNFYTKAVPVEKFSVFLFSRSDHYVILLLTCMNIICVLECPKLFLQNYKIILDKMCVEYLLGFPFCCFHVLNFQWCTIRNVF